MIPAAARGNPQELRAWFATAASIDPSGAQSNGVFKAGYAAVTQWAASEALSDRVSRAFHDPKLRSEFGEEQIEAAWRNPAVAYQTLIEKSASGRLSPAAAEALAVLAEVRQVAADDGNAWETAGAPPVPDNAAAVKREAAQLVAAGTERRLTPSEHARLLQLYEARQADDEAAEARRGPPPTPATRPKTRREQLLERYATTGLSKQEEAELSGIYKSAYGEPDADFGAEEEAWADEE